jgi:hypothetical protein
VSPDLLDGDELAPRDETRTPAAVDNEVCYRGDRVGIADRAVDLAVLRASHR